MNKIVYQNNANVSAQKHKYINLNSHEKIQNHLNLTIENIQKLPHLLESYFFQWSHSEIKPPMKNGAWVRLISAYESEEECKNEAIEYYNQVDNGFTIHTCEIGSWMLLSNQECSQENLMQILHNYLTDYVHMWNEMKSETKKEKISVEHKFLSGTKKITSVSSKFKHVDQESALVIFVQDKTQNQRWKQTVAMCVLYIGKEEDVKKWEEEHRATWEPFPTYILRMRSPADILPFIDPQTEQEIENSKRVPTYYSNKYQEQVLKKFDE